MYDEYNATTKAMYLISRLFPNVSITPLEKFEIERTENWATVGNAYFQEHASKPKTIGLALYDSPVRQVAWIGEKYIEWSDHSAGNSPSVLTHNEILKSVSLYFLSRSFVSSVYMYAQNPAAFMSATYMDAYAKARTDAPLLWSAFKYNPLAYPRAMAERFGNLVYYQSESRRALGVNKQADTGQTMNLEGILQD
ncbi:hypothetical protein N0V84_004802 [Fusarium piperis]|uniref:Uncharacterized protein n=1 Tax=Fusarium piperis TaxID=1435070 RepID=A0A9W8WEW0_9HYPO|nr:hypothetical protein N0V84_004802 [Fusarium piperis]